MAGRMVGFDYSVKNDDRYKSFIKRIRQGTYTVPKNDYIKEILDLHGGKKFRRTRYKTFISSAQKHIIENTLQTNAYRSRLVEIRMECKQKESLLLEEMDALKKYLTVTYNEELTIEYKTQTDRKQAVEVLLEKGISALNALKNVSEIADMAIDDLDNSSFALQRLLKSVELTTQREQML